MFLIGKAGKFLLHREREIRTIMNGKEWRRADGGPAVSTRPFFKLLPIPVSYENLRGASTFRSTKRVEGTIDG